MHKPKCRVVSTTGVAAAMVVVFGAVAFTPPPAQAQSIAGAWVWPERASANSCRWLRVQLEYDHATKGIYFCRVSGIWGQAPGLTLPPGYQIGDLVREGFGSFYNRVNPTTVEVYDDGSSTYLTIGPFCGRANMFDEPPADYPYVIGYLGSPGSDTSLPANGWAHHVTFSAWFYTLENGELDTSGHTATVSYYTVHDNDDLLEWYVPDGAGGTIDPISVGPVEVLPDSGSGSSTYTFRVRYKSGLYSGLNLPPRWRTSEDFPGAATFIDRSGGSRRARLDPDGWVNQFNWLYGRTTDPWLDQVGYARAEFNDRAAYEPQVLLVIDGQHWAPHYMIPEDPSDTNYTDGVIFRYTVRPTDYQNFVDNIFLLPFDLPGSDPWDRYAMNIFGVPTGNNYVSLTAGKHTFEFWATDDFAPVKNRAWVQVGWPGNDLHNEYMERIAPEPRPVTGLRSAVNRSRISVWREYSSNAPANIQRVSYTQAQLRRFGDVSPAAPDPFGYPYESHAPPYGVLDKNLPNVNPVLTAHPFFGQPGREGCISLELPSLLGGSNGPWSGGFIENDIPNNTFIPGTLIGANLNPFEPETGAGPNPPWKYTNDDTILPNYVNVFQETAPTPLRGGKWTQSTKYTLRINYWQSENRPPTRMQVMIAKVDANAPPGSVTDRNFTAYTMEKYDPSDNDYTDGVVYQYQVTPEQLPGGGGPGDYYYWFRASDGTREARFPDRPDAAYFAGINYPPDPADIGLARSNVGQDWYWFRVNRKPTLANQSVSPVAGRTGDDFVFRVQYTDPDLPVPNPDAVSPTTTARGDRPFVAHLYVDLYAQVLTVASVPSETSLGYVTDSGTTFADGELVGLYVVMQSGPAVRKVYRIVGNTGTTISLASSGDHPGSLITDGVSAGNQFYIAQRADMSKEDPADINYTDGVWYRFSTATNMILPPGRHRYFFEFADDWGSWLYPDQTDVRVEGEYIRYPNAGEFVGPEVVENTAPELVNFRFAPDAVGPGADGVTATEFTFFVTYKDAENNPPAFIRLGIDGTADQPETTLELAPDNPADTVYTDGAIFKSPPIRLTEGPHIFRAQASDGDERFPPGYPTPQLLPFKGPIATVTAPPDGTSLQYSLGAGTFPDGRLAGMTIETLNATGTPTGNVYTILDNVGTTLTFPPGTDLTGITTGTRFIFDAAPGPLVAPNTPPQLRLPSDDNDPNNAPGLTPDEGRQNTTFTYRIIYVDNDLFAGVRGNRPAYVRVFIDNQQYDMQPVDPTDNDYTEAGGGALYEFSINTLVEGTRHTYFFVASDGLDLARSPAATTGFYVGPLVDEPPDPPRHLLVADTPNDNGGSLDFNFNGALDDGGGPDDVTEYHLYRNTTGPPFSGTPVLVIPANKAPSYAGKDTTAKTGLQTGVNYFYTVRAYDGRTIDPNGDGIPDRDSQGNLVVPINPDSQSVDSNVEGPVAAVDNIAPRPPSGLLATDPGIGGTIDLSWTVSPDDGSGNEDVVEYYIYRNQTGAPFTGNPIANVPAGETSYRDQTAQDGTPYYYVVRAFDGSNLSDDSNVAGPITSTDGQGPEIVNITPAPGTRDASRSTKIEFDVRDTGAGVDTSSLILEVNGQRVTPAVTGSGEQVHVSYDPPTDFDYFASVSVHIEVADLAVPPNRRTLDYQFSIEGPPVFSISGVIQNGSGAGVEGVVVTAGGLSATTDANGAYTITGLSAGTYTVTPKLRGKAFVPETRTVTVPPSVGGVNFTAEQGYDITGLITDSEGAPVPGVRVTDGLHEAATNRNGRFAIRDLPRGDYTIVPLLQGYVFTPPSRDVTLPGPTGQGHVDIAFLAESQKFTVSGTVRTSSGLRLQGVLVEARNSQGVLVKAAETNVNGAYTLTQLVAGTYTIQCSEPGWTFEPLSKLIDVAADKTNVDFIAVPVYVLALPSGVRMVSIPVAPRDRNPAANVPEGVTVARYDPTRQPPTYLFASRGGVVPEQLEMLPGRSFWVRNPGDSVNLNIAGEPVDTTIPFSLTLEKGWNMAGNMYNAPLPWSNLNITPGQVVRDYGFLYNPTTGSYELVTDLVGIGTTALVPRNAGFWIKSDARWTVSVTPVTSAEAVPEQKPAVQLQAGDYLVPIVVRANGRADTSSIAGVIANSAGKYVIENPPVVSPYVDLYFTSADGSRLACDVRTETATTQRWDFVVATDMEGATVELTLPDLSRVPADKTVTLVDRVAGRRLYARTMPSYTYTADASGLRQFTLEIGPREAGGLVVSSTAARQTGDAVVITYGISRPATVTVTILNIAGRVQCTLGGRSVLPAGTHCLTWNLRTDNGTRVPAGRYVVRVSASAEDGQAVQASAILQVR